MRLRVSSRSVPARYTLGLLAAAVISVSAAAHAADPYRLEVMDQPVAAGAHSEFDVKLTKASTGEPVENAKITRSQLEMTMMHPPHKGTPPGGMATKMSGEVKLLGTPAPGVYRLMGDVSMPGTWKLDLAATVPGEAKPVEGTTTFKVQ